MKKSSKALWLTDAIFVIITVASFTGVLIPSGELNPKLLGTPYTVWMGVVFCIVYIVLAYVASKFQKEGPDDH